MNPFVDAFVSIRDFFEMGGNVLYGILVVTVLMWTFIIERIWYFYFVMPKRLREVEAYWDERQDTTSWYAN